jgi:predicted DNA-binding mobile mystery protein A
MIKPYEQLDQRFAELRPFIAKATRPSRGWVRAVREALGMTTAQLAVRIGVSQPRITEMEKAEVSGSITLQNLERAAEAMDCRVVYLFVPANPLTQTMQARALKLAEQRLTAVEQSMQLENQGVTDKLNRKNALAGMVDQLLSKPARLWDNI